MDQEPYIELRGKSMYPAIKETDRLVIDYYTNPKSIDELNVGEVVLIRSSQEWVAHRVVLENGKKKTKGDWSNQFDEVKLAWGQVVSLNGKDSKFLAAPEISQLSSQIHARVPSLKRKMMRIRLMIRVFFLKLRGKR